jgi:hypothetical protein
VNHFIQGDPIKKINDLNKKSLQIVMWGVIWFRAISPKNLRYAEAGLRTNHIMTFAKKELL